MSRNEITGDALVSAAATDAFRDGHDRIWGKKAPKVCRADGRCQYAIDSGAEGMGHCPEGKCVMPEGEPAVDRIEQLEQTQRELVEVLEYFRIFIESEQDDPRQAPWVEKTQNLLDKLRNQK